MNACMSVCVYVCQHLRANGVRRRVTMNRIVWNESSVDVEGTGGREDKLETATAGSDLVQSGRPIFDDFFQHLWPYVGNNTVNVVFQMVKRLWLIRIDQ
ncbi:hypothetical protein TNCV_245431 [Trichonephila clavipes]|nr:hypothetical protein TNCV_245431 [Trichonephila clavipes]